MISSINCSSLFQRHWYGDTIAGRKPIAIHHSNLPSAEKIGNPEGSGYKYIGILELHDIKNQDEKKKVSNAYFIRLGLLLKSRVNACNLIIAVNSWRLSGTLVA